MNEEILHREFFIDATRSYLEELTDEMIHDPRVKDFDKIRDDDLCKTDAQTICRWLEFMADFIKAKAEQTDLRARNYLASMERMRAKLQRKIDKAS